MGCERRRRHLHQKLPHQGLRHLLGEAAEGLFQVLNVSFYPSARRTHFRFRCADVRSGAGRPNLAAKPCAEHTKINHLYVQVSSSCVGKRPLIQRHLAHSFQLNVSPNPKGRYARRVCRGDFRKSPLVGVAECSDYKCTPQSPHHCWCACATAL